jgi:glycosyltransferase involved in cell wall biosynthesis
VNLGFVCEALPYLPARDGFRLYGAHLIRVLSRRHRIHLVTLLREGDADRQDWARARCASVTAIPAEESRPWTSALSLASAHLWGRPVLQRRGMVEAIRRQAGSWDVVHVEGGYAGGLVPPELPLPRLLSVHDSWTLRAEQMLACSPTLAEKLYYAVLRHHEPRYQRLVYPRYGRCVVVTPRDAEAIRAVVPRIPIAVIPNGVDTDDFRPVPEARVPGRLVFHGNLAYAPNAHAARAFADEILPLIRRRHPDAVFHVLGSRPTAAVTALGERSGIEVSADLPDLRPSLSRAQVYVCALRHGTGVKNKVLEAMAMGLPVVCYPEAVTGLDVTPGEHVLLADGPQPFAAAVAGLLDAPDRAAALGRAARARMERLYSWEVVGSRFEDLYRALAREHGDAVAPAGGDVRPEELSA